MTSLGAILSLLTAAAGWYYLFYSRASERLAEFEADRINRRRAWLRRIGGGVMILLGIGLYLGFRAADADNRPVFFVAVWLVNMTLMATLVILALVDVRLTARLRRNPRTRPPADASSSPQDHDAPPPV